MLLKVGELAKRTGLTVRTLHHYDAIGLLAPSARSDTGYRLYNHVDIARLHAIQALRHIGLPLSDIGSMLAEGGASLAMIIPRQIDALDGEIARATELRGRLHLLQDRIAAGNQPDANDWLATLTLMATYGKYFTVAELKKIFENWKQAEAEWQPLIRDVQSAMDSGIASDALDIQPLARRWMDLSVRWMEGDFDLLTRWSAMCRNESVIHGLNGMDPELFQFINKAIELRLSAFHKYLSPEEMKRLFKTLEKEWAMLGKTAAQLIRQGVSIDSPEAQSLVRAWSELIDRRADNDPVIREKLLTALRSEPLLQASSPLDAPAWDFIRRAYTAGTSQS